MFAERFDNFVPETQTFVVRTRLLQQLFLFACLYVSMSAMLNHLTELFATLEFIDRFY